MRLGVPRTGNKEAGATPMWKLSTCRKSFAVSGPLTVAGCRLGYLRRVSGVPKLYRGLPWPVPANTSDADYQAFLWWS